MRSTLRGRMSVRCAAGSSFRKRGGRCRVRAALFTGTATPATNVTRAALTNDPARRTWRGACRCYHTRLSRAHATMSRTSETPSARMPTLT
jgi:hypothetical protein